MWIGRGKCVAHHLFSGWAIEVVCIKELDMSGDLFSCNCHPVTSIYVAGEGQYWSSCNGG